MGYLFKGQSISGNLSAIYIRERHQGSVPLETQCTVIFVYWAQCHPMCASGGTVANFSLKRHSATVMGNGAFVGFFYFGCASYVLCNKPIWRFHMLPMTSLGSV